MPLCTDVEQVRERPELASCEPVRREEPTGMVLALQRGAGNQSVVRALGRCAGTTDGSACGKKSPEDMATFAALRRASSDRAQVGQKCACGGTILPGGECTKCRAQRLASEGMPAEAAEQTVARETRALLRTPRRGTAAAGPRLDVRPSVTGSACACLVFMHNNEANARLTAELMHAHCGYNLAIVPAGTSLRTQQMPRHGDVDPNGLFPRDVAEQCLEDPTPCEEFLDTNKDSRDRAVIEDFAERQFFLAIRECSNAFALPVIALHNNAVGDTRGFRGAAPDTSAVRGGTYSEHPSTDPGDPVRPLSDLSAWLDSVGAGTKAQLDRPLQTNIYRWCMAKDDIGRCRIGDPDNPDTVVWVTTMKDFKDLSGQDVNVVLQAAASATGESATDLSTLFLNVRELVDARTAQVIADLQQDAAVDVRELEAALQALQQLDVGAVPDVLRESAELLARLTQLAAAQNDREVRLSQVRFANIETPGTRIRRGQTADQLRDESFTSILTVLRALGLECCSDAPGTGEAAVRQGLDR